MNTFLLLFFLGAGKSYNKCYSRYFLILHSFIFYFFTVAAENVTSTDSNLSHPPDEATSQLNANISIPETNQIDNSKDKEDLDDFKQSEEELFSPERSSGFEDEIRSANTLFSLFRNLLFLGPSSESLHINSEELSRTRKHADLGELLTSMNARSKKAPRSSVSSSKNIKDAVNENIVSIARRDVADNLADENSDFHELRRECAVPHPHHIQMLFLMHVPDHKKEDGVVTSNSRTANNPIEQSLMQWIHKIHASENQKDTTLKTTNEEHTFVKSSYNHPDITTSNVEELTEENEDAIYVLNDENEILSGDLYKRKRKLQTLQKLLLKAVQ